MPRGERSRGTRGPAAVSELAPASGVLDDGLPDHGWLDHGWLDHGWLTRLALALTCAASLACAASPTPASAPEPSPTEPSGAPPEAIGAPSAPPAITHHLPANDQTVQWGWLDPKEPPKLTIASGDVVAVETLMHARDQIQKGTTIEQIVALRKANPGGGPHSVTGPIYVNGAEPGDMLEIRILEIVPKRIGTNFNLPGKEFPTIGTLPSEFPDGHVRYFDLDPGKSEVEFKPGITLPLRPFPGTLAVGIDPMDPAPRKGGSKDSLAPVSTLRPWKNGSNMDINELVAGSTLFVPVFLPGGLIWTGDSHCAQGNGEVNLTALECSFERIVLQPIVHEKVALAWPRIETPTHYISVGFDESLDQAMVIAVRETVDFLAREKGLERHEAYALAALAADCRVSQVVDIRKGIHCMVPKSIFRE